MKKRVFFAFITLFGFCPLFLAAEIFVESPLPGEWANRQMLVISHESGSDYYYSLNGSNPEEEGFAYDGPVLIDLTGDVTVKITQVYYDGRKNSAEIKFTVNPSSGSGNMKNLVSSFSDTGVLNYSAGAQIAIPKECKYTFEQKPTTFIKGRTIKYSDSCILSRFMPCTITDGSLYWRFYIRTNPKSTGAYSRNDVPFEINNWTHVELKDSKFIYKLDDNMWGQGKNMKMEIDRSKTHIIYWQSADYQKGNPVEFVILPPKPRLVSEVQEDKSVRFYLEGADSYSMAFALSGQDFQELYSDFSVDTFFGDKLSSSQGIAVYADSLYQGTLPCSYEVDKRPPLLPVFNSSTQNFYTRGDVHLSVASEKKTRLYVAVSEPFKISNIRRTYEPTSSLFANIQCDNFVKYDERAHIVLPHLNETATFYKVRAYASDSEIKSEVVEYSVIVDNFNYYFDSEADPEIADGTAERPYPSFIPGDEIFNSNRYGRFFVRGSMRIPEGQNKVSSHLVIYGQDGGEIVFPKNSSLSIENTTVQLKNCRIRTEDTSNLSGEALVKVKDGTLDISECEFVCGFGKSGNLFSASSSVIKLRDSVFSASAQGYVSLLSTADTRINVDGCRISAIADTAVLFSVRGADFRLSASQLKVTGTLGRIAELYGVKAVIQSNEFKADLKNHGISSPLFSDKKSSITETANSITGF